MGTIRLAALMNSAPKYTYRGKSCSIAEQVAKKLLVHALLFVCSQLHAYATYIIHCFSNSDKPIYVEVD